MKNLHLFLCLATYLVLIPIWGQVSAEQIPDLSPAEILTPPTPATPAIHGPKIFGVRPGSPFLYNSPATGDRPMQFSVQPLPSGLHVDAATGQITGSLATAGNYDVVLHAKNAPGLL